MWDTLVRASGTTSPAVAARTTLFGSTNVGTFERTNLTTSGQLASDQTYVVVSMRCWLYFNGTNRRLLYQQVTSQLYFTFTLGDKPQFQAPYNVDGNDVYQCGLAA